MTGSEDVLKKYECDQQMSLDDWMTKEAKAVPIWKRYPANCRGLCPKCGTEVYYDATYGQRISSDNWNPIDGDYRGQKICPKCKTEFDDNAQFPYDDYESYPTLSGIDDKPIKDDKPSAPVCQFSGHECNKKELWKIADGLDDTQCPHVCCRRCNTRGCGARCNGSTEPVSQKRYVVNGGKWEGKCATCKNWHFNEADSCSCEHIDCKAPEYKDFVSAIDAHKKIATDKSNGWREPRTCDLCDTAFGSIVCFERRGYFYLRHKHEWLKGRDGQPMISPGNIICHKLPKEENKHEQQPN